MLNFLKQNWFKLSLLLLALITSIQIMRSVSDMAVTVEQNQVVSTKTDNINQNMNLNLVVGSVVNSKNEHLVPELASFTTMSNMMNTFRALDTFAQLYSKVVVTSTGNVYLLYPVWKNVPPNSFYVSTNIVSLSNHKSTSVHLLPNILRFPFGSVVK